MFLKLFKHELKCSCRSFLTVYAASLLLSIFGGIFDVDSPFTFLFAFGSSALFLTIIIMSVVMIIRTYHASMFSRASYLTHTLPVSASQLMFVKMIAALFWWIMSGFVLALSLVSAGGISIKFSLGEVFRVISYLDVSLESIGMFLYVLCALLSFISLCYLVMNAAHTCYVRRYRTAVAIILYIVISMLAGWLGEWIFAEWGGIGGLLDTMLVRPSGIWLVAGWELLLTVLYSCISCWLLEKKLEVE